MTRLSLSILFLALASLSCIAATRPNIVIIFTDDLGYGDLACFGSTTIRTPRLDQLAREGTRFTSFYVQVVCGPSRSALLTGRQPVRSGGWSMPASEVTLAELLSKAGYATACIGKWDVSNRAPVRDRMPNAKGFHYYYGPLGANDNGTVVIYQDNEEVERTADMGGLTRKYTDKAIEFVKTNKGTPFLVYLAHTMVHSVVGASSDFKGKSQGGLYGDAVEEIDFHSGRLLDTLQELGLRDTTLVIFTSDNGAWNNFQETLRPRHNGEVAWGSSGPLREGKGSTYEGGLRVPCIVRWPGQVPAGRVSDAIFASLDFLPTFGTLAGYQPPQDRVIDGVDQSELLLGKSEAGARTVYHFFCQNELQAVRKGPWKLHLPDHKVFYGYVKDRGSGGLELYNLKDDLGETKNLAREHPKVVEELLTLSQSFDWPEKLFDNSIGLPKGKKGKIDGED
jgi:arylsulfatase A-like enzyme